MFISKKAAAAVTCLGVTSLGIGGVVFLNRSSRSNGPLNETESESIITELPSSGLQSGTSTQISSESMPQNSAKSGIKPMTNQIKAWKEARTKTVWKNWYLGSEGAISNVENLDLSEAKKFSEVDNDSLSNFFGQAQKGDYKDTRSSLRIRVQKWNYPNGKWRGSFNWFWSFVHKNRGFITFNVAESFQSKQGLKLTGGFYLVEKGEDGKWKVKYYEEVEGNDKTITVGNFSKYFPKPYWYTQQGGFDKYYYINWGFVNENDLKNICGSECSGAAKDVHYGGAWEWSGGKWYEDNCNNYWKSRWCDNVYEWSSDHGDRAWIQWYYYMYGNSKLNLKKSLSSFLKGYWRMDSKNMPKYGNS